MLNLKQNKSSHKIKKTHKYIFVLGGVMSGIGKGITTSSIGALLQSKGFIINLLKVDPYLNIDAGTMNPIEHGEVFVLDSGLETDQDMGNYERFLNKSLTKDDYITSGMIYKHVIEAERALKYDGKCVEAIPHIRDEIIYRFTKSAKVNKSDITVIEIGGTIGDYQNIMFIEAARYMKVLHPNDIAFVMVSYLPIPSKLGEMKSKPTQNAIHQLNSYGVNPDIIIARSEIPIDHKRKEKIAISCGLPVEQIISAPDIENIFNVPINFEKDNISYILLKLLHLRKKKTETGIENWIDFANKIKNTKDSLDIAIVGKYFNTGNFILTDAYVSVLEAIKYSSYHLNRKTIIHTINSRDYESENKHKIDFKALEKFDGIIVPGGFGESGIEGKLAVIQYARENKIPYFGLCYGMQLMIIEYARNILNLKDTNTAEINLISENLVINIMPDQKKKLEENNYGGSMRLGTYPTCLEKNTIAYEAYQKDIVDERHRHRYEVNPKYIKKLTDAGLVFSGKSPNDILMEIAELPKKIHPFFLGTQFHPEFLARPFTPHPLFTAFIKECIKKKKKIKSL